LKEQAKPIGTGKILILIAAIVLIVAIIAVVCPYSTHPLERQVSMVFVGVEGEGRDNVVVVELTNNSRYWLIFCGQIFEQIKYLDGSDWITLPGVGPEFVTSIMRGIDSFSTLEFRIPVDDLPEGRLYRVIQTFRKYEDWAYDGCRSGLLEVYAEFYWP